QSIKLGALGVCTLLAACAVGPDYERPATPVSSAYKQAQDTQGQDSQEQSKQWKTAAPADGAQRGAWWKGYGDTQLDVLQTQLVASNQSIAAAEAAFRRARALAQGARASFFPGIDLNASSSRGATGTRSSIDTQDFTATNRDGVSVQHLATLDVNWELDLWGRIRREVEAGDAELQASSADLGAVLLSAQAELATNYFQLRVADAQQHLFDRTVAEYEKSLQLTRNQYAAGIIGRSDVLQAEAQLRSAQAQAVDNELMRRQLEHAIAILVGRAPADVEVAVVDANATQSLLDNPLPPIPAELPSALLERRPDIAAAERRVMAA